MKVKAKDITKEIEKQLRLYAQDVDSELRKSADIVTKEAVKELKKISPKRPGRGNYANSWTRRREGIGWRIYNKDYYRLTHLLEYGHVVISWNKNRGDTGKYVHIRPVEQKATQKFGKMVEDAIK